MKLGCNQVVFHPLSYGDPSGRVFWWEGGLYRAISGERLSFYEHLLSEGIIQDLVRRKLVIDTEATDLELEGYGLVLKHRAVPFVSYCHEWCGEMLKAAALSVLELEKALLNYGLTLQDAHPWNVLFVGATPVWVDLGSLLPTCGEAPWHAFEEFLEYFDRPLRIMAEGYGHLAHCLLSDGYHGVQQHEMEAITKPVVARTIRVAKAGTMAAAKTVVPPKLRPFMNRALGSVLRSPAKTVTGSIVSVDDAIRAIRNIRLVQSPTLWSNYYGADFPDFADTTDWTEKHRSIAQILSVKKPRSVLDIGSNSGWYSQLAARNGAQVVSVDSDEPAVTKLFSDAVADELPILPLVADFRKLSPFTSVSSMPGVAPAERLRCEMVLALALVHHLVFTQLLRFDQIVSGLSAFAQHWLVIEFIGLDDPYVKKWANERFSWYTLETLLCTLNTTYSEIQIFESDLEHRRVLLCERR